MKTTQRTAPAHARTWAHHFEASSVLLFAALTFGTAGAVQAQSGSTSGPSQASKSVIGPASSNPAAPQATFGGGKTTTSSAAAAFDRADADRNGMLSPQEASTFPAIGERFQSLDKNQDKMLSREEFEAGAKS